MSGTLNMKAASFIRRTLFLAEPQPGRLTASLALSQLAAEFCWSRECEFHNPDRGCRKHGQAVMLGMAKLLAGGEVLAEMSTRGVVFIRLAPAGVMEPAGWTTIPAWWYERPQLVAWAESDISRRRWEAKV